MSLRSSSSSSRKNNKRTGKTIPVPPPASEPAAPITTGTINSTRFQRTSSGYLGSSSKSIVVSAPSCPESQSSSSQAATAPPKTEVGSLDSFAPLDPAYIESLDEGRVLKPERQKYNPRPLFLSKREIILQEFLRLEGRGDYIGRQCANCPTESPSFRCKQCTGGELFCKTCIVALHKRNPLHNIEAWEHDGYFTRVTLRSLGLRIQLGHSPSESCRNPAPMAHDGFIVLDVNGIHEAAVDFCECETAQPHFVQLLRYGWYPASVDRPKTAATMNLLKLFTLLNFESKASLFEFYNTLNQLTCNTGLDIPKDRYSVLGEMAREYEHIKSLKRAGRGHKPGGADATSPGECAVLCPLCPQGDKNLEEKWEAKAQKAKHKYTLFLAIDANFRLKRRNVSSWDADPSFGDGWSYFVPSAIYKDHISTFDGIIVQSKSTCSNHKAVNEERSGKGLAATGVCTVDCARHDMKRPLGVGDLHQGERYVNVDFMFCSSLRQTLRNNQIKDIVSGYDVGCQWKVNFWERNTHYPPELSLDPEAAEYRVLVPKFHLPAHISACQTKFSYNYAPGVGRTDGEACERGWSRINPIATSTMEMGPGTRQDLIDAHFRYMGWKKYTIFDVIMLKATKEAVQMSGEFRFLHDRYRDGLPPKLVERWEQEVVAWEMDPENAPNPYEKKFKSISQETVRKRLVADDKAAESGGNAYVLHEGVSASTLIMMGLDLEDEQRQIEAELNRSAKSELSEESAKFQNRVNILQRKITAWINIQHLYVPLLHDIRVKDNEKTEPDQPETPVHSIPLYLPSSAPSSAKYDKRLVVMEYDLRHAQAHDALDDVRNALRLRSHVYQDKDRFQRGQRRNTRSLGLITRLDRKCSLAAGKYRAARLAVLSLAGHLKRVGIAEEFPELAPGDIRGLMDDSIPDHIKESQAYPKLSKNLSWIWKKLGPDSPPEDENLQDDLRIEFCKSRALCNRWGEEVDILEVETERGLRFLARRSSEWTTLASLVGDTPDGALFEGKRAYALEQAAQFGKMRARWAKSWRYIPDYIALG